MSLQKPSSLRTPTARPPGSNEPLLVQALEEAILFRQSCADGNPEPYRSEDRLRIREYRKLLHRARGKVLLRKRLATTQSLRAMTSAPSVKCLHSGKPVSPDQNRNLPRE